MGKLKMLALMFAFGTMLCFVYTVEAGAQPMGPGMMYGYYGYQSLTPEKQAKAQRVFAEFYAKTIELRQQVMAKQYELHAMIYSGKEDEKKVQQLTKEISELRSKLFENQVALQRQLAKEDIPWMGGMGGYGGPMGPGMMGPGYGMY
jgi:zinc resistance-associated protein